MKVKLISMTPNPIDVMWAAARTCYSEKSPVEMWEDWQKLLDPDNEEVVCDFNEYKSMQDKHWNLVKKVLDSGHQSVAEHVYFTFAIEGISRACSHQLVRHRAGIVFSQQSQRYVEIKEDIGELCHLSLELQRDAKDKQDKTVATFEKTEELLNKYFVMKDVIPETMEALLDDLITYKRYIEHGYKAEDARSVLPNATKTNITMSLNYRELIHICNLRLCTRAQLEIRQLFQAIKKEVEKVDERLASLLVPSCEIHGMCFEDKCCGRKPKVNEVKGAYKLLEGDDTILSGADWEQLMESISKPEVNDKLAKFMKSRIDLEIDKEDK